MAVSFVKLQVPDSLIHSLKIPEDELNSFFRQTVAVELYREGRISLGKAREFAGLTNKWEMIQLLNQRNVDFDYTAKDAQEDLETLSRIAP